MSRDIRPSGRERTTAQMVKIPERALNLLDSLRPSFASKHPHFNFITIHCQFVVPLPHFIHQLTSCRFLDYWHGFIRLNMPLSSWHNRIHRRPLPLERFCNPEWPEYSQFEHLEHMAANGFVYYTNAMQSNCHQYICCILAIILV